MQNKKKISVGISFYNAEPFIELAIRSVLNQTYTDFELILIDDGSTDSSLKIAKSFADSRIRIISDGENKGLIFRLNQIIKESEGDFFVRMDADDIMFPDRLEKQIKVFKNNSSVDLVHTDAISITNNNSILGYRSSRSQKNKEDILSGAIPMHPTVMARMQFFKKNNYQNNFTQMEDLELWYRTIDNYVFYNLTEPCLFYREDSSLISKKHFKMIPSKIHFVKNYEIAFLKGFKIVQTSRIKGIIYSILEKLKIQKFLMKSRSIKISGEDYLKYDIILKSIIN